MGVTFLGSRSSEEGHTDGSVAELSDVSGEVFGLQRSTVVLSISMDQRALVASQLRRIRLVRTTIHVALKRKTNVIM